MYMINETGPEPYHNDRLDKIFVRIFDPDPNVSKNNLEILAQELARLQTHPSQVKLIFGKDDLLNRLFTDNCDQKNEPKQRNARTTY